MMVTVMKPMGPIQSVHSFVRDYIEARKASRSARTAGPKDLTVAVHWPNSSHGPNLKANPDLEEVSQSRWEVPAGDGVAAETVCQWLHKEQSSAVIPGRR
jgi:hypothetical protein